MTVDADAVRGTFGPATSQLDDVAARAGDAGPSGGRTGALAGGVAALGLRRTSRPRCDASFQRWFDLERRSSSDYQTVVLAPPGTDPTHQDPAARC